MGAAFFPQLQLSKASRESIEVSLRTRVWCVRLTLSDTETLAAFPRLGETHCAPDDPRQKFCGVEVYLFKDPPGTYHL